MNTANKLFIVFVGFTCLGIASYAGNNSAKILLFGDFGTGAEDQLTVADDMVNFCRQHSCDYAITTGDNLYPRGVENLKNGKADYDNGTPNYQIIIDRFVKIYGALKMPFYMSFGNHDVGNEGPVSIFKDLLKSNSAIIKRTLALMRNQISFSNHKENPAVTDSLGRPSRLWILPDEYYHQEEKGNVHLFALNTNTFPHRALNVTNDAPHETEKNFQQRNWLDASTKSVGGWKIVFGHMPLHSHGLHYWLESPNIKSFRNSIIDTLCDNRVDFYISGHDHHLEVDKHECANGHVIVSVLTGAAAKRGRIYKSSFSLFSKDKHLLWGNGQDYLGDKSIYSDDAMALGFSHLEIIDANTAKLTMKLSVKNLPSQQDGCFAIVKGKSIVKAKCE